MYTPNKIRAPLYAINIIVNMEESWDWHNVATSNESEKAIAVGFMGSTIINAIKMAISPEGKQKENKAERQFVGLNYILKKRV